MNSHYCVVNSFIKPKNTSYLYNQIKEFSNQTKIHLRHDKLQRGLCINKCELKLQMKGNLSENYFVKKFPMDSKVSLLIVNTNLLITLKFKLIFDFIHYPNVENYRSSFDELVNKCVNIELMDGFNLSAFSTVEYCLKNNDDKPLGM